jgi:hypothetical protein
MQGLLGLLDEQRVSGAIAIRRLVGPPPLAHLVKSDDVRDALEAIETCCQLWGGAANVLVPWDVASTAAIDAYQELLSRDSGRRIHGRGLTVDDGVTLAGSKVSPGSPRFGPALLSVIAAQGGSPSERRPIRLSLPPPDDPWYIAYLASLGSLPSEPDPVLHEYSGLRGDVRFDELVEIQREPPDSPGAADLVQRLRMIDASSPSDATRWLLGSGRAAWGFSALSHRYSEARAVGPNLVVVYDPGSIQDLCLLWNLRASSGAMPGAPLGVPITADVREAVNLWTGEMAFQQVTLWLAPKALVSHSVDTRMLTDIAADLGDDWRVLEPATSLQPFPAPARTSSDVALFEDGKATATLLADSDQRVLDRGLGLGRTQDILTTFELMSRALPPIRSIEPDSELGQPGYRGGGYSVLARNHRGVAEIQWPSGWLVLNGAVRDRGRLRANPSSAGKAATALLRRMGSLEALEELLSPQLLELLDELCQRRGMPWFRRQLRRIQAALHESLPDTAAKISDAVDELRARPFDQEETAFVFDRFLGVLTRRGAQHWVPWAEASGLLVRGVQVHCPRCGAKSWQTVAHLSITVICPGCGLDIEQPFRPDRLEFRYRASEALLAVSEHDALAHLLALRWFWRLYAGPFSNRSELYGAYPGVEIVREETGETREVDLLLLLADGSLIPGELKRRGAGLQPADLEKLDDVVGWLDAPWSFVGTLDFSADCPPIWNEARRNGPRARYVLTGESIFAPSVVWPALTNPFDLSGDEHPMLAQPATVDSNFAESQSFRGQLGRREEIPGRWLEEERETE